MDIRDVEFRVKFDRELDGWVASCVGLLAIKTVEHYSATSAIQDLENALEKLSEGLRLC